MYARSRSDRRVASSLPIAIDSGLMHPQPFQFLVEHAYPPASRGEGSFGGAQPAGLAAGWIPRAAVQFAQSVENLVDRYRLL